MMTKSVRIPWALGLGGWLLAAGVVRAQAYVEVKRGNEVRRVDVERIVAKPNGALVLFRQGGDPVTLQPGQYDRAVGVKPKELDQAMGMLAKGMKDQAAALLRQVMQKNQYLSWDARAGSLLAGMMLEKGDTAQAESAMRQLRQTYGNQLTERFPELQMVDWKVRIAGGAVSGLDDELADLIEDPASSREKKAMAQMVRGDLKSRREDFRAAVLDYLRTAYFFSDVADVQAEALYKTASTFHALGDVVRARTYEKMLKERHPDSIFAIKSIGN